VGSALSNVIAAAASHRLGSLGLRRKGRSRTWIDDHGWWLVHVEFQPSQSGNFYLNVGDDHLFVYRDHLVFEDFERPLGGTWLGDDNAEAVSMAVDAAAEAVIRHRVRHGEGKAALTRLAGGADDLVGGIAAALLGDGPAASQRLTGQVHQTYRALADAYLGAIPRGEAGALARSTTNDTRVALRLPPSDTYWSW
jgi:hypothetical protein